MKPGQDHAADGLTDAEDFRDYDDDCGNCGGEGVVYDCIDGFCEDAESGCDLCATRCDWCRPVTPSAAP